MLSTTRGSEWVACQQFINIAHKVVWKFWNFTFRCDFQTHPHTHLVTVFLCVFLSDSSKVAWCLDKHVIGQLQFQIPLSFKCPQTRQPLQKPDCTVAPQRYETQNNMCSYLTVTFCFNVTLFCPNRAVQRTNVKLETRDGIHESITW